MRDDERRTVMDVHARVKAAYASFDKDPSERHRDELRLAMTRLHHLDHTLLAEFVRQIPVSDGETRERRPLWYQDKELIG